MQSSVLLRTTALVCLVATSGCASAILASMAQDENRRDQSRVLARAEFDLGCPRQELRIVGLSHWANDTSNSFNQYGVAGCGRRAVYVETASGWVLDSTSEEPAHPALGARAASIQPR